MLDTIRNRPQYFGVITGMVAVLNIICISLPFWMSIKGLDNVGPYQAAHHGSSKLYSTECDTMSMSQSECGYLFALQISSVLTVLFGGFSAILFCLPPKTFAALPAFVANTGVIGQVIFSLITIVLFYYFKANYYDDDGINQEYPGPEESDISYSVLFYLWITGTIVSFSMATVGYSIINKSSYDRKGLVNQS
jgi:hypothetical protein